MIYTLGHSTRKIEDFIGILKKYKITEVVDIRTVPRSGHNPQYNIESLPRELAKAKINYIHFVQLGGLRSAKKDSPNLGWKNASFRGYADYMQTGDFNKAIEELIDLSKHKNVVLVCAETLWWRCHRRLVADSLTVRGIKVFHILNPNKIEPHKLTPWIKVEKNNITYPEEKFE